MTTRRKYWLHISSTNQATSQVNTASSPQTARNFGIEQRAVGRIPVLHDLQPVVDLAAQRFRAQVTGDEDRLHGPAQLDERGVGGVLRARAGEAAQDLLGLGGA